MGFGVSTRPDQEDNTIPAGTELGNVFFEPSNTALVKILTYSNEGAGQVSRMGDSTTCHLVRFYIHLSYISVIDDFTGSFRHSFSHLMDLRKRIGPFF
jgi:hypothetical protein